ncbi:UvrB/UvrC motif-containing protein [Bacillus sp. ISL-35]|uniref:UvrB/UvrC motif-containing protein n=1 Tax=Bacillus sp. ISL-35 TaxID=2819122 RepID=UPI001BE6C9A1|nr:UvrB/UvrC motif-containing protein [Bacillus sp. ISL-35]MBT2679888.1 UvrB/UvrC motif-containing protein [Bacillus sp. ISL-35]MBT2704923.1 UvrB/UvrC motif-containing protein [Chryseobacterium sp. ISL-80]
MKDQKGTVIYVGKAKSLKKRVQTYFQNSAAHPQKIKKMVANINDFHVLHTDTEFEAFLLECKLIKELQPLFNKKMKSHLPYSYIAIKMDGPFRKISIASEISEAGGTIYFGPYTSMIYVKKAIENLKEYFKINCLHPLKGSPCLNYTLGKCNGLCLGGSRVEEYNRIVEKFISFLQGFDTEILDEIEKKMNQASEEYQFEEAAKYRNYMKSLSILLYKENMIQFTGGNKNIVVVERINDRTLKVFLIKGHNVIFSKQYHPEKFRHLSEKIKDTILYFFQENDKRKPVVIGKEELDEAQIIYSYLNGGNARFIVIPEEWLDDSESEKLDESINQLLNA